MTKSVSSPEQLYVVVDQLDSDQNSEFSQRLNLAVPPIRSVPIYQYLQKKFLHRQFYIKSVLLIE